jgi:hypothetical protein
MRRVPDLLSGAEGLHWGWCGSLAKTTLLRRQRIKIIQTFRLSSEVRPPAAVH